MHQMMQARKRIHHEDTSVGNGLQNRTWSHDSEEEEIASENTLLNEVGQRFVRREHAYKNYFSVEDYYNRVRQLAPILLNYVANQVDDIQQIIVFLCFISTE